MVEAKKSTKPEPKAEPVDPSVCVVDDGTPHMGRAVNGAVCSRHANRYDRNGRRRGSV